jgi:hypothetical protein
MQMKGIQGDLGNITGFVGSRLGIEGMEIPLSRPDISEREIEFVSSVLRTPFLSLGPMLPCFEQ